MFLDWDSYVTRSRVITATSRQLPMELDHEQKHRHSVNEENRKHEVNEPAGFSVKLQLLATGFIVFSALSGGILGIILSEEKASDDLINWYITSLLIKI